MTLRELNHYFNEILRPQDFSDDPSMNGIQVQNSDMDKPINKIAFAVDAALETILRAKEAKAVTFTGVAPVACITGPNECVI